MTVFSGYRTTSGYGNRTSPISGKSEFHTGIDLVRSHRAPIQAFVAGEVVHARMGQTGTGLGGFGITVALVDKYGTLHMYAHLDSAAVPVGAKIEAGHVVGYQGNTGQSAGSHLHYEVRKSGRAPSYGFGTHTDPTAYLQEYFAKEGPKTMEQFTDVPANHWAASSIKKAADKGIISGVAPGVFGLGQPVTREQLAVILDRLGLIDKIV